MSQITIRVTFPSYLSNEWTNRSFGVTTQYSSSVTVQDVLNKATDMINNSHGPKTYIIREIYNESFTKVYAFREDPQYWMPVATKPLTYYNLNDIINKGLIIGVRNNYIHKVNSNPVTCPQILNNNDQKSNNNNTDSHALKCPIYKSMKISYNYTVNNLKHITDYTHFKDEYNEKTKCRYGQQCKAFIRLQDGSSNRLSDKCHIKIFRHPPRTGRQISLSQNTHSFIVNKTFNQNHKIYVPTNNDKTKYNYNDTDGYLNALLDECIKNNFKYDLCLQCGKNVNCIHNVYATNNNTLLSIVDQKLASSQHIKMGKPLRRDYMLALILYTGGWCNYDLCGCQRNGNYLKWIWFDHCLWWGISILCDKEIGTYKLYSGLNNVKLNKTEIMNAYFPTYTSTTWIKDVTKTFMGNNGMLIEIDALTRSKLKCCNVQWISYFPNEYEVLIARSDNNYYCDNFSVHILDKINSIQTIALKHYSKFDDPKVLFGNGVLDVKATNELLAKEKKKKKKKYDDWLNSL